MKRRLFEALADQSANENAPLPPVARYVNRAGRSLAVLLELQDARDDEIRVALDALGGHAGGYVSGTIH